MSDAPKAAFLSYAREDTDAARRIADALRAFGVEVWFDQSELRGGDAWDQKIKKQIRECALFVALVSGRTQERAEGYFRREWKLAVERTHDMAAGVAFIVPVVIDDTAEGEAAVPDEFMRVQWTRLPKGVPSPQFVEQIKRLLEAPRKATAATRPAFPMASPAGVPATTSAPRPTASSRWMAAAVGVVLLGAVAYLALRPATKEAAASPKAVAETKPTVTSPIANNPSPGAAAPAAAKSIAVLPFANFSPEKDNEFFADGLHDEVITALAKIHDLKVISRTSVMAYRNPEGRNLKKIAAELGVATVLEGSVQRAGNKVHLNVQLIDAQTDNHLWADSYTKDLTDVFSVQSELAEAVTSALKATLSPEEKSLIARRPTQNQEAYDLYLRARAMHQEVGEQGTRADFERVIGVYEQAIAKDPSFALAHAQVALVHSILYWFGFLDPTPARAARMKAEVDEAVRLAPAAPETHLALGAYYYRVNLDWNRALAEFRLAEARLPNDSQLFFWLALTHRRLGHWTESLGYFEHSIALNPRDLAPVTNYVEFLADLRHWAQAGAAAARFLAYFPTERVLFGIQALAQLALTGDRAAYGQAFAALPRQPSDPTGAGDLYRSALWLGDYAAADRALADARLAVLPLQGSSVINDPITLHRALLAFLRGDPEAARRLAGQAIDFYRGARWNGRQQPWVQIRIAMAEAWAGRREEAVRDGQAAMTDMSLQDAYDATKLREMLGEIYVSLGQREDAIATLREMMNGPCALSPNAIRLDPLWSRLKDDPRFEEILKSAKPL